jgi:hypothetical protein
VLPALALYRHSRGPLSKRSIDPLKRLDPGHQTLRTHYCFEHAEIGLTRFPPNVEQITVRRESGVIWLIARRNETELKFPLMADDCQHLSPTFLRSPLSSISLSSCPARLVVGQN